jgi:leader peptidase (prepilin peptidase)/N-methyltransferase
VFDIVAGLFGLLVGSFLNVVIYRVPVMMDREEQDWLRAYAARNEQPQATPEATEEEPFNLIRPGSSCPKCGAPVKPHQNIPILSYLFLRGRCASCGVRIALRYPIIEGLAGIASVLVAWRFGFSVACAGALLLSWTLIALTVIDLDRQWLPDRITLPLLWVGLGFSLIAGADGGPVFTDPRSSIIGAMAGYLSLWSLYKGFKLVTGKEGMGYGDFKLLAALGAWLGWQMLLIIILLSAGVGLVAAVAMIVFRGHDRQVPIPFGPYLATAGFIALLWGPELLTAWLGGGIPAGPLR